MLAMTASTQSLLPWQEGRWPAFSENVRLLSIKNRFGMPAQKCRSLEAIGLLYPGKRIMGGSLRLRALFIGGARSWWAIISFFLCGNDWEPTAATVFPGSTYHV